MVVLATIDSESSLRNTENLITTESDSAREFGEELGRALSICVEKRMRPFSEMERLASLLFPEMKGIPQITRASEFLLDSLYEYVSDISISR